MLVKPPIPDQRITDSLTTAYGIEITSLTFLPLGADIHAWVYKAVAQDQSSYFVKLKRGHHHDISLAIVSLLHNAGIEQVISPVNTTHGQSTEHIDGFTLIVYPFIEGQDGFSQALTDQQWFALGNAMREVHLIDVPLPIQKQLRREDYSPKWREIVRSLYIDMETWIIDDEAALKLSVFMKENRQTIHRIVDSAERLAKRLQDTSPQFVLCHSDIHGGNVLIPKNKNNAIYIVDWDEPIMAPKERDLMFVGAGVGNVWNKPHEETLFYEGYGSTEINRTSLAYYRCERIVEDVAIYGQALLMKNSGDENRSEMYQHFIAMFEPMGVVDMALNADE